MAARAIVGGVPPSQQMVATEGGAAQGRRYTWRTGLARFGLLLALGSLGLLIVKGAGRLKDMPAGGVVALAVGVVLGVGLACRARRADQRQGGVPQQQRAQELLNRAHGGASLGEGELILVLDWLLRDDPQRRRQGESVAETWRRMETEWRRMECPVDQVPLLRRVDRLIRTQRPDLIAV